MLSLSDFCSFVFTEFFPIGYVGWGEANVYIKTKKLKRKSRFKNKNAVNAFDEI